MTPEQRAAYAAARTAVMTTQERYNKPRSACGDNRADPDVKTTAAAYSEAHKTLLAATVPIKDTVNAAWDANRQAVQVAATGVAAALRERTRIEIEVGTAARERNPARPVLSADELARAQAALDAFIAAQDALDEARATFKAGVSADQLDKVT